MRKTLQLVLAICTVGCGGESLSTESNDRLAPPTPSVTASTRVVSSGDTLSLEVSVSLTNPTTVHFQVVAGACPFLVRIFPDSSGAYEYGVTPGQSMTCPSGGPTIDLAPRDSIALKRTFPADLFASLAPGLYGVNVDVSTDRATMGLWGGVARLPLAKPSSSTAHAADESR